MKRYWLQVKTIDNSTFPIGVVIGVGITAYNKNDALLILDKVFNGTLCMEKIIENVDISSLDNDHVLPNIGNVLIRGMWFPKGYQ